MCANVSDIEFGTFLVIVFIVGLDANGLYCGMAYRSSSVCRSIYVSNREWASQGSQSQGMVCGEGMIDDHSFCTTVKEGTGTDFLSRLLSDLRMVCIVVWRIGPAVFVDLSTFRTGSGLRKVLRVKAWFVAKA